ncbi:hypothetical protein EJB05_04539 [Eragrostis curvula]|uniref:Protein kinase domain-containing protein n=1 Tax=Eragrostis curvula TaxID=38414 RepID=A0A5J9WA70_9POAL|nr:hypothetical protein EJB05_04539 [Eragrostis curvula]
MHSATANGGGGRARSRSFGGISSAGDEADVFVRAGPDNEMYVRADQIDLKNLDAQLEKTRSKVWLEHQRSASPRPRTPLLEWEIDLAKLDIHNQIAHGTFGVVYRGTYDGHDVAVKVLDWGQDGHEQTMKHREAFEKEVAVWQKLDHPNVTKFVGASMGTSQLKIPKKGSTSGGGPAVPNECCVVVVEFQHGGTLKTLLYNHRDKKLPYKKVVQLALDLARGRARALGIRPDIPRCCPRALADIMARCWDGNPDNRPEMSEVVALLERIDTAGGKGMTPVDDVPHGCSCFGFPRGG